jgi:hypothetical protein
VPLYGGPASGGADSVVLSAVDPMSQETAQSMVSVNDLLTYRIRDLAGPRTVTKVYLRVSTASGNIDVAIFELSGTTLTRLASSGSVACPASGEAEITLSAAVELSPSGVYFVGLACDNTTATFLSGKFSGNHQGLPTLGGFGYRHHTRGALAIGATVSTVTNAIAGDRAFILGVK